MLYKSKTPNMMKDKTIAHYDPKVSPSVVLCIGIVIYLLAQLWPPLILAVTLLLSQFLPYAYRVNDDAVWRRRLWKDFEQGKDLPKKYKDLPKNVDLKEEYWVNQRGLCLMTSTMLPKDGEVKAVVCFCHGYGDNASFLKRMEFSRFVQAGIAFVSIEYEGHGRSDGRLCLIPSFPRLVDDTSLFFEETIKKNFPGKSCFLAGESMGGAVAYYTYKRNPDLWCGVIFISPMCKIADEMKPPQWVIEIIRKVAGPAGTASWFGRLPIAPASDVAHLAFRLPEKREMALSAPTCFRCKPRIATARELLDITSEISNDCENFDAPFLMMHGLDDIVTCPKLSQYFYDAAKSKDKEIRLYDGMWHTITSGEPDENIDLVFNDAISWVKARI